LWPHLQREKVTEWKSVRINDYVWNEDDNSDDDNDEEKDGWDLEELPSNKWGYRQTLVYHNLISITTLMYKCCTYDR